MPEVIFPGPDGRLEQAWRNVRAKGHAERVARETA